MLKMAAESNAGFHHDQFFNSAINRHAISIQSSAMDSTSDMILMGNYYGVSSPQGMLFSGNSSIVNSNQGIGQASSSSGSLLLDSVPGLKHDAGLAVEWSAEEQYKLEEGLVRYADEPSIMKYVKIAAALNDKTVRDVAMRCKWMMRKRRKPEDHMGKKLKDRKDKLVESYSTINISSSSQLNVASYSLITNHLDQSDRLPSEALNVARHLLEQNNQVLCQISANLSTFKLQDNIDLFCRTRSSLTAILNNMREMPGIMSQMPPLPLSINEELANSILPSTSQTTMFGSSSGIHLKQEPGC